jgi:hypothetical protein
VSLERCVRHARATRLANVRAQNEESDHENGRYVTNGSNSRLLAFASELTM